MKIFIIFFSFFTVSFATMAQEKKLTWDYPVKPGTEEWDQLKTEDERIAAVQIPENILTELSSDEVIKLCVSFPLFGYFTAFNSSQEGFRIMLSRFNVFQHLLAKKNIGNGLLAIYKDAGMSGFEKLPYSNKFWTIKLDFIELVISQEEVILSLTPADRMDLVLEAKKKFSEKLKHESFASLPSLQSTALIMARILKLENNHELKNLSNNQDIEKFVKTGSVSNATLINDVVKMTDSFIEKFNNNKIKQ